MKTLNLKTLLTATAATACTCFVAGQPVEAGGFKTLNSDWNIVYDSFNDGTTGKNVGAKSDYEMFGMAAKIVDNEAYFAFNGNLDIGGKKIGNKWVTYGDLFFNFTDKSFQETSGAAQLYGIHFAPNDAGDGNLKVGLYENVTAKAVAKDNYGHKTFSSYQNYVETKAKDKTPGAPNNSYGQIGFGDLSNSEAKEYFTSGNDANYSIQNVIDSGNWLADITMLGGEELAGLDFGTNDSSVFSKAKTFGFKFDVGNLPSGDAFISLLHECFNDGVAMKANFAASAGPDVDVPEPTSIVSLGLIGLALAGSKVRKKVNG